MNTTQWKENLLTQLKARNEREYHPYRDLIIACKFVCCVLDAYDHMLVMLMILSTDQKILSQVDSLRRQNTSLEYRNNQLQEVLRCNMGCLYNTLLQITLKPAKKCVFTQ